ncbi:glycosyltransferase family 4 protein [Egicoccus halophilus]|uniref:glycosyltransferase family 4 protein n=1 Tax=Egicoccus halophilus TaxID=1670830 RepID=UPI0013EE9B66|nr:glycosyltransferase family 4 protein [Egicoccus halophilus]
MKSLHVVTSPARRGAETFAIELVAALHDRGDDADIAALHPTPSQNPYAMRVLGTGRRAPATLRALRQAAQDVDVVVAHGSSTLEACSVALAGSGTPFVYRFIGDPSYWTASWHKQQLVRLLLRRPARYVALWQGAGTQLAERYGLPSGRIGVIPNGVPEGRFSAVDGQRERLRVRFDIPPGRPCLGFVGALAPEKNLDVAIVAAARSDAHLLVAGDGPERTRLETLAARLAPGRVAFLGTLGDPREVYWASDVLVLPSRSEGMPAVVIEAALAGVATVATRVGALPDMIVDGETGFLVEPDRTDAFVARVSDALSGAVDAGRRAQAAFERRYTMGTVCELWRATMLMTAS